MTRVSDLCADLEALDLELLRLQDKTGEHVWACDCADCVERNETHAESDRVALALERAIDQRGDEGPEYEKPEKF